MDTTAIDDDYDSRDSMSARRCQRHNALMEELGRPGTDSYYYCPQGDDVQKVSP